MGMLSGHLGVQAMVAQHTGIREFLLKFESFLFKIVELLKHDKLKSKS